LGQAIDFESFDGITVGTGNSYGTGDGAGKESCDGILAGDELAGDELSGDGIFVGASD
jgi:hypothetical protein